MASFLRSILTRLRGRSGSAPRTTDAGPARFATIEVDPRQIGPLDIVYAPVADAAPDAGEVLWTWVPYAERNGQGKDRPVLAVASAGRGRVYAVKLTSRPHDQDVTYVPVGAGAWDPQGRASWADVDQLYLVHPQGMRRQGAVLGRGAFDRVAASLARRYGWRAGR